MIDKSGSNNRADYFLKSHKLRTADIDFENLVSLFTEEMELGLAGKPSSLRMIPTYIEPENEFLTDTPVLAIDAGGTNFRAAIYTFTSKGKIVKGDEVRESMPGIKCEVSSDQFFRTIASYIGRLAAQTDRIGFCFSYPTEIFPDRDGRLLQFCKEIQAPEVVGQFIGKRLLEELGSKGKQIVLLNDTVATLLAGKSDSMGKRYDSYIGYILGTGTNTCYIEANRNILKNTDLDYSGSQIINVESGAFGKGPASDIDTLFDNSTIDPGKYTFEKMFAGGYLGGLCLAVLKVAASESVFAKVNHADLSEVKSLSSEEAQILVSGRESKLHQLFSYSDDLATARYLIANLIERAAYLAAANMASVVMKTGKGRERDRPVLITIEGSAFYKLHNLEEKFRGYLEKYLTSGRKRYIEYAAVKDSSLMGAALAGLTPETIQNKYQT